MHRALRAVATLFAALTLAVAATAADPVSEAKTMVHELSNGDPTKTGFCSAVALAPGVAMTAAHCASGRLAGKVYLHANGKALPVTAWNLPNGGDTALLTVPGLTCPCAERAPAVILESFANVLVLGYPLGGELTETYGIFVGWMRVNGEGFVAQNLLVLTAPVKPGNSGGGAFIVGADGKPYLIGIVVAQLGDGRMSFAEDVTR